MLQTRVHTSAHLSRPHPKASEAGQQAALWLLSCDFKCDRLTEVQPDSFAHMLHTVSPLLCYRASQH